MRIDRQLRARHGGLAPRMIEQVTRVHVPIPGSWASRTPVAGQAAISIDLPQRVSLVEFVDGGELARPMIGEEEPDIVEIHAHGREIIQHVAVEQLQRRYRGNRKSTRLNSSHQIISYA